MSAQRIEIEVKAVSLVQRKGRVLRALFTLSLLYACSSSAFAEAVENSAKAWFVDEYVGGFINGDPGFMDVYADQTLLVIKDNVQLLDRESLESVLNNVYVRPWVKAGWESTALIDIDVEELGSDSARVTASWAFLDSDGKNVVGCDKPEWHYIVVRDGETWRVVSEIEGTCS